LNRPAVLLTACLLSVTLLAARLAAEVGFAGLDLSADNRLLFRARTDSPRYGDYDTLFQARLEDGEIVQLTFFPEDAALFAGGSVLQVHNRFGLFRTDPRTGAFGPISNLDSFVRRGRVENGALSPLRTSPDGRCVLRVRARSAAFGDLVVHDLEEGTESVVSQGVEIDLAEPPFGWSPLSDFFVYSKGGALFYYSLRQLSEGRVPAEEYRRIGEGRIRNVRWARDGILYYLSGSLLYRMDSRELFTRALYSGYLPIGQLVGKIPFSFDPSFDRFWMSPAGDRILLAKSDRNVFVYPVMTEDFVTTGEASSLPYLYLPRSRVIRQVLWSGSGILTLLTEGVENGSLRRAVYRLRTVDGDIPSAFREMGDQPRELALSPDERTIAAVLADRVQLIDLESWQPGPSRAHPDPLHALWSEDGSLVIAGSQIIERWSPGAGEAVLMGLSQAGAYSFSADEQSVLVSVDGGTYRQEAGSSGWQAAGTASLREKRTASGNYRVYLEEALADPFRNAIMVRDARGFGTRPLLSRQPPQFEPFPAADEPVDPVVFAHGSRIRRREVALVFNAVDSIEGLPGILATLNDYKIRATFFVNGEVIRRYPDAVQAIAEAGHEVGSLFYIYFNMTDSRFQLDRDFIKRGLARNEDDYYAATGRELSLLWHAPYYFVNSDIVAASREMNYVYVSRDVDSLDWVTREMSFAARDLYLPAARLVERVIAEKRPGSIVPVLVGTPKGIREDFLFQKLDLLIDGLMERGYRVVPVTTLIEHAR
jgi:peptidoglycan/xylan/chitin deacetylase (PgdA/CDA1 family)